MKRLIIVLAMVVMVAGCGGPPEDNAGDKLATAQYLTLAVYSDMKYYEGNFWEYMTAERALTRGTGMCSQYAIALNDVLHTFGIKSEVYGLEGHVIVLADIDGVRMPCDALYGIVIPIDIRVIESNPVLVDGYYPVKMSGVYDRSGNGSRPYYKKRLADVVMP